MDKSNPLGLKRLPYVIQRIFGNFWDVAAAVASRDDKMAIPQNRGQRGDAMNRRLAKCDGVRHRTRPDRELGTWLFALLSLLFLCLPLPPL